MAVRGREVEGIAGGIEAASTVKGAFNQNMIFRRMSAETREGFGQVVELDTTMNAIDWEAVAGSVFPNADELWGYKNHLGSYLMNTSNGHKQVVSVFSANVRTGDRQFEKTNPAGSTPSSIGEFTSIYIVSIYDLTTDQRWEEPIYDHTSSFSPGGSLDMPDWHGNYESSYEQQFIRTNTGSATYGSYFGGAYVLTADYQKWVHSPTPDSPFFFTELDDVLYFGNKHTGLLAYYPSSFRGKWLGDGESKNSGTMRRDRSRQAETVRFLTAKSVYSESSVVVDAIAVNGAFDGFEYLTQTEYPKPVGATSIDARLAVFSGKEIYFSDVLYPTSVVPDNVLFVPSEEDITAIAEHTGNLIIFTENETWLFRPSPGFIITGGNLVRLADGIGCASMTSVLKASGTLFWMDKRGCYRLGGSLSIERISDDIEPFFNDFITNPLTSYYTTLNGMPAYSDMIEQGSMRLRFDPKMVSSCYFAKIESVVFCIPEMGGALCFSSKGEWGWWSFESNAVQRYNAGDFENVVGVAKNIRNPWVVCDNQEMFLVSSYNQDEQGERVNQVGYVDTGDNRQTRSRPYSILRYGRGGSLDRSLELGEDRRSLAGQWRSVDEGTTYASNSDHYLYIGKPIPIPSQTTIGTVGGSLSLATPQGSVWVPIEIIPGDRDAAGAAIDYHLHNLTLTFSFDSANWETIPAGAGPQVGGGSEPLWFLPPERQSMEAGWQVLKTLANTVSISYDGATPTTNRPVFGSAPLNLNKRQRNRVIYIPFRPKLNGGVYAAEQGMSIQISTKDIRAITAASTFDSYIPMRAYIWEETRLGVAEKGNNHQSVYVATSTTPHTELVAQPVDWAYKTRPIADEGKTQIKGRGLRIIGASRGAASDRLISTWPTGLLNTISGADYKEWSSQVVDIIPEDDAANTSGEKPAVVLSSNKQTIRTRFKNASTGALVGNTFNTTNGPTWGTPGVANSYTYITDEEETSLLSVSDGIRGQSVSYMMWGHIQNKAEKIILHSAKVIVRILGGVRRRGR